MNFSGKSYNILRVCIPWTRCSILACQFLTYLTDKWRFGKQEQHISSFIMVMIYIKVVHQKWKHNYSEQVRQFSADNDQQKAKTECLRIYEFKMKNCHRLKKFCYCGLDNKNLFQLSTSVTVNVPRCIYKSLMQMPCTSTSWYI